MEARDLRSIARDNLSGNWALSVGVAFAAALFGGLIVGGGVSFNLKLDDHTLQTMSPEMLRFLSVFTSVGSLLSFVAFLVGGTLQLGYARFLLKQHNRADFEFRDLFSQFHRFGQGFAQAFLRGLYTFLWALLFIIPGIVKSYAYAMTPFIMAENPNLTANEAITASKEMMDGHKARLFFLDLSFFGWMLLCALTLGIGNLFLAPYMNASRAAFYKDLTAQGIIYE